MATLEGLEAGWDAAAREDAMFNILTLPGMEGRWERDAFLARGRDEIAGALVRLRELGLSPEGPALDFGCGVGRLTHALADQLGYAVGVDVSGEMVARAFPHRACRFVHNASEGLPWFSDGEFGLVYSMIALQHVPRPLSEGYVREFMRVLRPGGVAMFHVPEGPDMEHPNSWLSMYGVDPETVASWVAGHDLVDVELFGGAGPSYRGWRYTVRSR